MLVLPMLLGSLILGPRQLPWFIVFMLMLVVVAISRQDNIRFRRCSRSWCCSSRASSS